MIARFAALVAGFWMAAMGVAPGATLEQIGSFDQPIFTTSDPEDPDRLFVAQRDGVIVETGGNVFADLGGLVSCCTGERGLLSIALAPDFETSDRFYAAYAGTVTAGGAVGDIHVDAFQPGPEPDEPVREPILAIGHSALSTHNGGQLQFGPDGYLYISVGDGGGVGDPMESGQDLDTLLGKLLRIDPEPGDTPPYDIPPGNPFAAGAGLDEIWAYGLRNPWRFSFDRGTGDLVVPDVGQGEREEINLALSPSTGVVGGAGDNYGWNCREGLIAYPSAPPGCTGASGFTDPVFDYPHSDPGGGMAFGCAITGGYVVRDPSLTDLFGRYVYADFCRGEIRSLALPGSAGAMATDDRSEDLTVPDPVSFGEDADGRIYVASKEGDVFRLAPGTPTGPEQPGPGGQIDSPTNPGGEGVRRLRIGISRRGPGLGVEISVRAVPCPENAAGRRVRLRRGGKPFAAKRLDGNCRARFQARVAGRSTFTAFLSLARGGETVKSRRLIVHPAFDSDLPRGSPRD